MPAPVSNCPLRLPTSAVLRPSIRSRVPPDHPTLELRASNLGVMASRLTTPHDHIVSLIRNRTGCGPHRFDLLAPLSAGPKLSWTHITAMQTSKPTIAVLHANSKQGTSVVISLLQTGKFVVKAVVRNADSDSAFPCTVHLQHTCARHQLP